MKNFMVICSFFIVFLLVVSANAQTAKRAIIFPFFTKGKEIPEASIGVLNSIVSYTKFLPTVKVDKSDFDAKDRDIKEITKIFPAYDEFIIGKYKKDGNVFVYEVFVYDRSGSLKNSFNISSEDLFDIIDLVVIRLSSYYGEGQKAFAVLNFKSELPDDRTYTLLLNDEVLSQLRGKTNFSQRIVSKTLYNVILRDDVTKEVLLKREITLLDNEAVVIELKESGVKEDIKDVKVEKPEEKMKYTPFQAYSDIQDAIVRGELFNENAFKILQEEASVLDVNTRLVLYEKYELGIAYSILASVLNIVPGMGSILIGDTGGFFVSLLSPWISFMISLSLSRDTNNIAGAVVLISGAVTIGGYIYNLARPFIYQSMWNGKLEKLLLFDTEVSLEGDKVNLSMNIRF